jgi:hypothetical protein
MIWAVFGDFTGEGGGLRKHFMIGIDRARRARPGTSLGIVLHAKEANPFVFFNSFHVFSVFFSSFFDFRGVRGGIFGNFFFGINRAHQVLLGISETRVGTHM